MNLYDFHTEPQTLSGFYDVIDFLPISDIIESGSKFDYLKDPKYSHKVTDRINKITATDFLSPIKVESGVLVTNLAGMHRLHQLYRLSDNANKQLIVSSIGSALNSHMDQILSSDADPFAIDSYISRWIHNAFDTYDKAFLAKFNFPKLKQAMANRFNQIDDLNELSKKYKNIELTNDAIKHIESVVLLNLDKIEINVSEDKYDRGVHIWESAEMTSSFAFLSIVGQSVKKRLLSKIKSCYDKLESDIIKLIKEKGLQLENIKLPKRVKIDSEKWGDLGGYEIYSFDKLRSMSADRYHELNTPGYFKSVGQKMPSDLHDKIKNLVNNMSG